MSARAPWFAALAPGEHSTYAGHRFDALCVGDGFSCGCKTCQLARALRDERCNGCGLPRRQWGPTCGGMTQGDFTHFHSPEWWRSRAATSQARAD